jgi:hypothetical protein
MERGTAEHKVGARVTDGGAVEQQADVPASACLPPCPRQYVIVSRQVWWHSSQSLMHCSISALS